MAQSINLIPQQEVQEQRKTKVVKFSTVFSIFVLVVVTGVSAYFFYKTMVLKGNIRELESQIEGYREEITSLAPIEISARNLYKKYVVLRDMFDDRKDYSFLFEEIDTRRPETIEINNLSIDKGTSMNISGTSDNYISIATFMNYLLDKKFENGNPDLSGIFTTVRLNSVNLDKGRSRVKFVIIVDFDGSKL